MPRLIAAFLTLAWLVAPAAAQDSGRKDDKQLARDAAKIMKQLTEGQREAVLARLRKLTPDKRRAVLSELVRRHADKLTEPSLADELQAVWDLLPPAQRQKLLAEAMATLQTLPPKERAEVLRQYAELQAALNRKKGKKAKKAKQPEKGAAAPARRPDAPKGGPLRRLLTALDRALDEHGPKIDETLEQVGSLLEQGREYLELYRSMPKEQRDEVLRGSRPGTGRCARTPRSR